MSYMFATGKLKAARELKGWSQQEFADLLSLDANKSYSLSYIQKIETQVKPLTPDLALEISRFLRIDLKELVIRK